MKGLGWKAWAVIIVAGTLSYFRTSEAMIPFGVRSILGYTDPSIPIFWAYICAGLVEGVAALALDTLLNARKDTKTKKYSGFVGVVAVIFAGTMNLIDIQVHDGSLSIGANTPLAGGLHAVLTLLPLIIGVLFAVQLIIDKQNPDQDEEYVQPKPQGQNRGQGGGGGRDVERWRPAPEREPEFAPPARVNAAPLPPVALASPQSAFPANSNGNGNGHMKIALSEPSVAARHGYGSSTNPTTPRP